MLRFSIGCAVAGTAMMSLTLTAAAADVTVDFHDLSLPADSYYNGSDEAGGFTSRGVHFATDWGIDELFNFEYWSGFAYSNIDDTTTAGHGNQFAAFTGSAASSEIYAVGFGTATLTLPTATTVRSAHLTNTTYAALSMRDGDGFASAFAEGDWFAVTVTGLDANENETGAIDIYLADFRSADSNDHYILDQWAETDLQALGEVSQLRFAVDSSNANTPAYFALDELTVAEVPEPATLMLLGSGGALMLLRRQRHRAVA
ncbi:MAG: DUF4465 domain-containing protein [Phycisphaeraceae bacterium]